MKKCVILIISIVLFSNLLLSNDTIKCESKITDVTVFFNGAQINRKVGLELKKGKYILALEELPLELNPRSIQIEGLDNITILSVKHSTGYLKIDKKINKDFEDKINGYELKIREIKDKINVLEIEERILLANSQITRKDNDISINDIKETADFYRSRLNEIRKESINLSEESKKIQNTIQELYLKQNELSSKNQKLYSRILVAVDCNNVVNDSIKLSYYIPSAGWEPLYDFRVQDITRPLGIVYNANIYQSSGENWDNVNVTLSTNDPLLSGSKPELITWYIEKKNPYQKEIVKKGVTSLQGKVTDGDYKEPLPFANVVIKKGDEIISGTSTDFEGKYIFKPIEPGKYDMEVSFIGYKSVVIKNIEIINDRITFKDVEMSVASEILGEIQITDYKVPLISTSGESFTIAKMPARSFSSEIGYVDGNYSDIRGSRSDYRDVYNERVETSDYISNSLKNNVTNLEYVIEIPYVIPSDGKDYTIRIKESSIPVKYVYHAVPKLDNDVFLTAEITDWNNLNLLSGKSNIYYQGTYIGETYIDTENISDTLSVSLGRDKGIIIKRESNREVADKKIIGNNIKETVGWDITIRNNKNVPINIVIEDQFPITSRKSIEIERIEYSGAKLNDKNGKIIWEFKLDSGAKETLYYKYSVKYNKSLNLSY